MWPSILVLNLTYFRTAFPEFGNENAFPNTTIQQFWDWATTYISDHNFGVLRNKSRQHALNLMTAHLLQIRVIGSQGDVPGIVTEAHVGEVDVKLEPPPLPNQWQFWLGTTIYGQELLALLQVKSAGGFYSGGSPVRFSLNY
jgi:hypothetical protein